MKNKLTSLLLLFGILFASTAFADEKWETLFNGKDLTGWRGTLNDGSFTVKDGVLRANTKTEVMDHLLYVGDSKDEFARFKDFELELYARSEPGSNSGIFIHTDTNTRSKKLFLDTGYEVQLNSTEKEKRKTGSLYDVVDLAKSPVDESKWFRVNITVIDKRITVKLNGEQVIDYTEPANPKRSEKRKGRLFKPDGGAIALQAHDPESVFYFKGIRVRRLP